jgi:hypothetical protein
LMPVSPDPCHSAALSAAFAFVALHELTS